MEIRKVGRPKGATSTASEKLKITNKKLLLKALKENMGILAPSLEIAAFSRGTFNKYYNEDLEFRNLVDAIREDAVDFVESQLFKQIKNGGAPQTIFYLKTKGKSRGYVEQTDNTMTIDAVRIKYIVPEDNNEPALPLHNQAIRIELPDKE